MTNEIERPVIKQIDNETIYRATINLYSKGDTNDVTLGFEFSHTLDDDFTGPMPAAYEQFRTIIHDMQNQTATYAASPDDIAYLSDPDISDEDKARRVLEITAAFEEAAGATLN